MREFVQRYKNEITLIFILFLAAILRFYNFSELSFSNDELSALNRTKFDDFSELIKGGVETDAHPAGVEVFLYFWKSIFGNSVASIRFPFVFAGILSILFLYLLTAKWVNKTSALFAASSLCFLQYTILYSQLARPYSLGLLFCLATAYFWTKLLFDSEKSNIRRSIGFIVCASLATYTHYFSFLTVTIIGVTGLFFMKKHTWKCYVISGVSVFLLFIPHLSISFQQFSYNLGWLGKPEKGWIWDYIGYCFNNSNFLLLIFAVIIFASLIVNRKNLLLTKFQFFSLSFFLLPFFIGYFYSIFRSPVLQYSVLIFSFPFFLILLFSFIPKDPKPYIYGVLLLFNLSGIASTVVEKKYYNTQHFAEFKGIAEYFKKWNKQYGSHNITKAINLNAPYYIHYYLDRMGDSSKFITYKIAEGKDLEKLISAVSSCETPYFAFATSNAYYLPESKFIIMEKYPCIVEEKQYFSNSFVTLMSKGSASKKSIVFESINNFEWKEKFWDTDPATIDSVNVFSGKYSCKLDEKKVYSSCLRLSYSDFPIKDSCWACVSAQVQLCEGATAELVLSVEKSGRELEWYSTRIQDFKTSEDKWGKVFLAHILGSDLRTNDIIKAYVWNTGKQKVYVDDLKFVVYHLR